MFAPKLHNRLCCRSTVYRLCRCAVHCQCCRRSTPRRDKSNTEIQISLMKVKIICISMRMSREGNKMRWNIEEWLTKMRVNFLFHRHVRFRACRAIKREKEKTNSMAFEANERKKKLNKLIIIDGWREEIWCKRDQWLCFQQFAEQFFLRRGIYRADRVLRLWKFAPKRKYQTWFMQNEVRKESTFLEGKEEKAILFVSNPSLLEPIDKWTFSRADNWFD